MPISRFDGKRVNFKASHYIQRIAKYCEASACCFVVALLYLERFKSIYPDMVLTSRSVQRLLLVAVMTAVKYLEDVTILNTSW
jgi:hypothetical protein